VSTEQSKASAGTRERSGSIALWRIEPDPAVPGRIVMRDEAGATRFVSGDGGRSWRRNLEG
jgi:hypothetical protein